VNGSWNDTITHTRDRWMDIKLNNDDYSGLGCLEDRLPKCWPNLKSHMFELLLKSHILQSSYNLRTITRIKLNYFLSE